MESMPNVTDADELGKGTAASRYSMLESDRSPYLDRAREVAKYTIPALYPPEGKTGASRIKTPYQGIGARGVNNLAAKLLLALLPPNSPFFKLSVDDGWLDQQLAEMDEETAADYRSSVDEALSKVEQKVMAEVESTAIRVEAFDAMKRLIVGGNVLLYLQPAGGMRAFPLSQYVCRRDPEGNPLEIVVKEVISPLILPEAIRDTVRAKLGDTEKSVALYTHVERTDKNWTVYQEAAGLEVPDSRGTYPLKKCPWLPLRFTRVDGEDYGRGYAEEYLGDLISLEALTRAIVQGSAACSKVLFLVAPNGTTKKKDIAEAESGDIRSGNANDVTTLQVDKFQDFQVAKQTMDGITERLSFVFLLNTAIQRSGERVTAEEIRFMAGELEDTLGGIYSILSQEFQRPLADVIIATMKRKRKLPQFPDKNLQMSIVTGVDALGRGYDLQRLDLFVAGAEQTLGSGVMAQHVNVSEYLKRRSTALGINQKGLIKTPEEIQAEREQAMQMQMMQTLGPNAVKAVGDNINNAQTQ